MSEIDKLKKLLQECRKVLRADGLHRGNPERKDLQRRIAEALKT